MPPKYLQLKGKQIGDLKVLGRVSTPKGKRPKWRCECSCGKRISVGHQCLIRKNPKSHCGCKRKGPATLFKVEYHAWWDAKQRCHDPKHPSYPSYGAKGVRMCAKWRKSFEAFLADVKPRPSSEYSLDRIKATGNYEPKNVRWATLKTQARNKRGTKWVVHPDTGKKIKAADLADEWEMKYQTMRNIMIEKGMW